MKKRRYSIFQIAVALSIGGVTFTHAADQYWNPSPLSDNWAGSVWSATSGGGSLTTWTASNDAFFDQSGTYTATINADQTATNINIKAGAVTFAGTNRVSSNNLTIDTGASLTAASDRFLKVGTTTLTVNGTLNQTAAVAATTQRVIMAGGNGSIITVGGFRTGGAFDFAGNISGSGAIVTDVAGIITLSGNNSYSGDSLIRTGNTLRLGSATALSPNSYLRIGNGVIIELTGTDFSRTVSATTSGANVRFNASADGAGTSGFAAVNADRTVALNGTVLWGSTTTFNPTTFTLGTAASTHKVTLTTGIDLGAASRTINTANGSAAIEAEVSGALTNGTLLATGTGTLKLSGGNTLTTINKGAAGTDTGTLILSGSNTLSNSTLTFGTASENRGAIRLENNNALGGVTVIAGNSGTLSAQARIELANDVTISGIEYRAGGRSNASTTGAAIVNISGDNTWAGAVRIFGTGGGHGIRSDAGTLTISGAVNSSIGARTWEIGGAGNVTITGAVTTAVAITKFEAGTLTLSSSGNTYTGDTRSVAGSLVINHANALSGSALDLATADTGTVSFGPTITVATLGSLKGSRNLSLVNTAGSPAAVTLSVGANNVATNTYTGQLSGSGHLYKTGTGIQILDPGAVSISIGSLSANGGSLTLKSGTFANTAKDPLATLSAYNVGAGARGGTLTIDGATLNVGGGNNLKIAATTSGSLSILSGIVTSNDMVIGHNGAGTAIQSGGTATVTNLYHQDSGAGSSYTLSGTGDLTARRIYNNAATGDFTLNLNGGTLKSASGTTNLIDTQGAGAQISVMLGAGNTIIDTTASNASIVRPMGDMPAQAGTFTKIGINTLTLSAANTYSGNTVINNGTLATGVVGAIPSGTAKGDVVLDGGATVAGTLDLAGQNCSINGLSGLTGVVLGKVVNNTSASAAVLSVGNNDASSSFAGTLANNTSGTGTLGLIKTGSGTLTLSGANTYTDATSVTAGTLALVGGSQTSPITVDSGAALGFTLGSPTITSTSTVTFSGATAKVTVTGTPVAATLMTASNISGTPVLDPAIPGYELAIEGGGTQLKLKVSAPANPFNSWATTTHGLAGGDAAATADPDADGLDNLIEFVIGGQPNPANPSANSSSLAPTISTDANNLIFTYRRTDLALTQAGIAIVVEYGSDIAGWTTATHGDNGVDIAVTNDIEAGVDQVQVTIPKALAVGEKMFARLNVMIP